MIRGKYSLGLATGPAIAAVLWGSVAMGQPAIAAEQARAAVASSAVAQTSELEAWRKLPTTNPAEAEQVRQQFLQQGPQVLIDLIRQLKPDGQLKYPKAGPEDPDPVRYTLHGLALHVGRPGAAAERKAFAEVLASQLAEDYPPAAKRFLIQELQFLNDPAAVAPIAKLLSDEELCQYAAQALVALGGTEAAAALREALPAATGRNRLEMILALGALRDAQSVPALLQAAGDPDQQVRLSALWALASAGDSGAVDVLLKASQSEVPAHRTAATDYCLLLARRLAEASRKVQALAIYQTLWNTRTGPEDRNVRCAALQGVVSIQGEQAMDQLMAAIDGEDAQLRAAAVELGRALPGESATLAWAKRLADAKPQTAAAILELLTLRNDPAALPAATEAMKSTEEQVFRAAVMAFGVLGKEQSVPQLVQMLDSEKEIDRQAAQQALAKVPGDAATSAMAQLLTSSSSRVRAALLVVLPPRGAGAHADLIIACTRDDDAEVRKAAIAALGSLADARSLPTLVDLLLKAPDNAQRQDVERALGSACRGISEPDRRNGPLVAAMATADVPGKCALLRVLASAGGREAVPALREALKDPDADVQDAAVRGMSDSWDASIAPDLLQIIRTSQKQSHQVIAFRGYVRLAGQWWIGDRQRLRMYREAMEAAPRLEERKSVLGGLSGMDRFEALEIALSCLGEEGLREEAALAVVKIANRLDGRTDERAAAMDKVLETTQNDGTRQQATELLQKLGKPLPTTSATRASQAG